MCAWALLPSKLEQSEGQLKQPHLALAALALAQAAPVLTLAALAPRQAAWAMQLQVLWALALSQAAWALARALALAQAARALGRQAAWMLASPWVLRPRARSSWWPRKLNQPPHRKGLFFFRNCAGITWR